MVGYKVKEVARELNISEQAIYKKYREIEDLKKFIIEEKGVKLLTKDGLIYLKNYKSKRGKKNSFIKLNQEQKEDMKNEPLEVDLEEKIEFKTIIDTLEYFKEENKRLLGIIEEQNKLLQQQNSLMDNQIEVVKREQQISLNHTELLLVEKKETLKLRAEQYQREKEEQKKWYQKLFK